MHVLKHVSVKTDENRDIVVYMRTTMGEHTIVYNREAVKHYGLLHILRREEAEVREECYQTIERGEDDSIIGDLYDALFEAIPKIKEHYTKE